jgi:hypothetical protein
MTLGRAATARALLIVWRKACSHQVEPDPAEMAARYGAKTPVGAIGGCARGAAAHRRHGSRATELPSRAPEMFRPCPPARQGDVLKFGHDLAAKHCRLLPHRNVLSYCCSHSLPSNLPAGLSAFYTLVVGDQGAGLLRDHETRVPARYLGPTRHFRLQGLAGGPRRKRHDRAFRSYTK